MLDSRRDETLDELEDEEEFEGGDGGDDTDEKDTLSISERRARRKAKRQSSTDDTDNDGDDDDDDDESGLTAGKNAPTLKQRDAIKARQREALGFGESIPVLGGLITYLRGVSSEIQKVTWPTREEVQRLTGIVIAVSIFFAILLGAVDLFYGKWFQEGIQNTTTFFLIGVPFFIIAGGLSWWFILKEEA